MTNVFLGIDVGTQGLKGVVIDETGSVLATETAEYPTATPKPGWSEQSPEDWRRALDRVLAALVEGRPDFTFRGVGLTGQMHTTVVCDDQGRPLRSAILWSDQRTAPYVHAIQETYGLDTLLGIT
ncbi:MAG: FGGY family carbohydrate kinase, partial [Sulfobacillus sp.]|nr:FGGY family carbohydrate kinase [Sulfobacillus sp.]